MRYTTCENCGANLDPGEICDCEQEENEEAEFLRRFHSDAAIELLNSINNNLDKLINSVESKGGVE